MWYTVQLMKKGFRNKSRKGFSSSQLVYLFCWLQAVHSLSSLCKQHRRGARLENIALAQFLALYIVYNGHTVTLEKWNKCTVRLASLPTTQANLESHQCMHGNFHISYDCVSLSLTRTHFTIDGHVSMNVQLLHVLFSFCRVHIIFLEHNQSLLFIVLPGKRKI